MGNSKKSIDQMRELLRQSKHTSNGWDGDSPEQEWAAFISIAVHAKLKKLSNPDFSVFKINWLAIYDNLPIPYIELEEAVAYLRPIIRGSWSLKPSFDSIFVEHGPVIAQITESRIEFLVLNDLWG